MQQRHLKPERRLGQLAAGQSSIQTAAQQRTKFPVLGKLKIIFITGMNMIGNQFSPLDKQALFHRQQERINTAV
ncbi:hypothetical protein D3C73_1588410 [compost metagenome]